MIHDGTVDAILFKEFLKRLMIGATKPVFVIVDGHSIHKAKLVKEYVASLNGALKLFHVHAFAVVHAALGTRLVASGTSLIAAWVSGLGFGQVQTDSDISRTDRKSTR